MIDSKENYKFDLSERVKQFKKLSDGEKNK